MKDKRIFFLTTDDNTPSGGRMVIYHLVDMLVKHGFDAYALHQRSNFSYTWFKNKTPICYTYQIKKLRRRSNRVKHFIRYYWELIKDKGIITSKATAAVTITQADILVLPATRTSFCSEILPGVPKISLSQNPYLLFQCNGLGEKELSVYHPDIKARITMSRLNYDMHRLIFPEASIWDVPVFIDSEHYSFSEKKKRQIAFMPRRLQKDSTALINLLKLRDNLYGYRMVSIDGMSQSQAANILKDSLIFLSFSHREGFGLPPAEAMACGCIVIGYSGNGGDEFFNEENAYKIADGDLIAYVDTVEKIIQNYVTNPKPLDAMRKQASERILKDYSQQRFEEIFINAWKEIMVKINSEIL